MHKSIVIPLGALFLQSVVPAGAVPRFQVNLDEPPRQRWRHIAQYWKHYLHAMGPQMEERVGQRLVENFQAWKTVSAWAYDAEFEEEMQGILEAAGPGTLTMDHLKISNLLYEMQLPTMCTGVVAARPDGTVIQGRNLDLSFPFWIKDFPGKILPKNWKDVTMDVDFLRGGVPLYSATLWPGFVGIITGMRYPSFEGGTGGWSVQMNSRTINNEKQNLLSVQRGGQVTALITRRVLESAPDFASAVTALYNAKHIAPTYLTFAGSEPYQGAVVTTDGLGFMGALTPVSWMSKTAEKDNWYLVQTNDDQMGVPLDGRRQWGSGVLDSTDREGLSAKSMFHLMHTMPLLDGITVYTTVMVPKTGYYESILPADPIPEGVSLLTLGSCIACVNVQKAATDKQVHLSKQKQALAMAMAPAPNPLFPAIELTSSKWQNGPTVGQQGEVDAARQEADSLRRGTHDTYDTALGSMRVHRDPAQHDNRHLRGPRIAAPPADAELVALPDATSFLQLTLQLSARNLLEL